MPRAFLQKVSIINLSRTILKTMISIKCRLIAGFLALMATSNVEAARFFTLLEGKQAPSEGKQVFAA